MKIDDKGVISFAAFLVVIDQLVKHNIINPILNFGAGFGIFQNQRWVLAIISFVVIIILSYLYFNEKDKFVRFSYVFIVFGSFSNLIDRVMLGYVIDYISMPFWATFPRFNLGDSIIFLGVLFLVLYEFWLKKRYFKA